MPKPTGPTSAAKNRPDTAGTIHALVEKLYPFHYRMNGIGSDEAIPFYLEELPFTVHEYPEGTDLNGWTVPRSEVVRKAEIRKDGKLVYDGTQSPLGTIMQCAPFKGTVSLKNLKEHLHYHSENPDAIPFHCTQQYRTSEKDWGFCVTHRFFDSLEDSQYEVNIEVEHRPTSMKALDYALPGKSEGTIVFQAHNCHPFQANDDISGCAVGIRLMQELAKRENRHYTYRLLLSPEITGTALWLDRSARDSSKIKGAVILPCVGNDAALRLQESFTGKSFLDTAAHYVFKKRYGSYESGKFRRLYGNDETVFEAPGYEIPSISLTRYPFPNYHSNLDTPDIVLEEKLTDTLQALLDIVDFLEKDRIPFFKGRGLYCLSHPRYDLYKKVWDPSDKRGPKNREEGRSWNLLMTELPRKMDGKTSLYALAEEYGLDFEDVHEYCQRWVERGLAEFLD